MLHDDFYSLFNVSDTIIDSRTAGESKLSQESFQEAEPVSGRISYIHIHFTLTKMHDLFHIARTYCQMCYVEYNSIYSGRISYSLFTSAYQLLKLTKY